MYHPLLFLQNGNGYVDTKGKVEKIFAAIGRKLKM
jgi:hypothetical protein